MESADTGLKHNDQATITTRRGKNISVTVWKKVKQRGGLAYYSVIREDGKTRAARMACLAERAENAAARQEQISGEYYEKSRKDRDFLSLGEPIKVGHHSEKRHRKMIDDAWNNMGKSVAASDKAKDYAGRAETLAEKAEAEINLDEPTSVERLAERVEALEAERAALKASGKYETYQLQNLGANIRRYKERLNTARELWDLDYIKPAPDTRKADKQAAVNALLNEFGVFWAFNTEQYDRQAQEGIKYASIGAGGYIDASRAKEFMERFKAL